MPTTTDSEMQQLASRYQWVWAQEATQQYAYAPQQSEGVRPQESMSEYAAGEQQHSRGQRTEGRGQVTSRNQQQKEKQGTLKKSKSKCMKTNRSKNKNTKPKENLGRCHNCTVTKSQRLQSQKFFAKTVLLGYYIFHT